MKAFKKNVILIREMHRLAGELLVKRSTDILHFHKGLIKMELFQIKSL